MIRRATGTGLLALCVVLAALTACAGGFAFEIPLYTIDVSAAFAQVPVAAEAAYDEIDGALASYGMPPEDRDVLRSDFEDVLSDVIDGLSMAPTILPVPHLGAALEIGLPLLVIDSVRISGGVLSDGVLRWAAGVAGFPVPSPMVDVVFDENGLSGLVLADLGFSSWTLRTEIRKRLDALVLALNLGAGVQLTGGAVDVLFDVDVPPALQVGVDEALLEMHLDGLTWSAFSIHGLIGIELGPPFLRLAAEARFVVPISQSSGWWGIQQAQLGGSVGVTIRF